VYITGMMMPKPSELITHTSTKIHRFLSAFINWFRAAGLMPQGSKKGPDKAVCFQYYGYFTQR